MTVRTFTWREADGTETALSDANGYSVLADVKGLDAPPVTNTIEDYISLDGAALTGRRRNVRSVLLPLHVKHPTRVQSRIEELTAMLLATGELAVSDGTNSRALRDVVYEAGLEGDLARGSAMPTWRKVVLSLLALDPWWYGDAVAVSLPVAAETAFDAALAFDSVLPFDGGASVATTVVGHAEAFPVITVVGPATVVTVGNGEQTWQTAVALMASDTLIVDTRPGHRGPRRNGGNVDWSLLTAASRLWTLTPGLRSVIVGVVGSTGATSVGLTYEPRWSTP